MIKSALLMLILLKVFSMEAQANYKKNCSHEDDPFGKNLLRAESIKITPSKKSNLYAHTADYLVISCIDFRLNDEVATFLHKRGLRDNYDLLVMAGASLGIMNEKFPAWEQTFLDHLQIVQDLHQIKGIIIIDHRNCGLYRKLLGTAVEATHETETKFHHKQFLSARKLIHSKYPKLKVEGLLMGLDGKFETLEPLMNKHEIECCRQ